MSISAGGNMTAGGNITQVSIGDAKLNVWHIEALKALGGSQINPATKANVQDALERIDNEIKEAPVNKTKLETLVNTVGVLAPDILDVVVAGLNGPLAVMNLVVKKIADKAVRIVEADEGGE